MQGTEIREQGTGNREQGLAWLRLRLLVLGAACVLGSAPAQQIQFGDGSAVATAKKPHVELLTDAAEVAPGSPQMVELQFRVEPGFHINSHMPKDETLIPTVLKLDEGAGLKVLADEYPAGSAFRLKLGNETETLDVYQGEFRVRLRVIAAKGASTLTGTLRYQACDNAACFPPRSLPVRVAVRAK